MSDTQATVLVVGASGVIGQAVLRHFSRLPGWRAVGVARRTPVDVQNAELLSLDLTDRQACEQALGHRRDITHIVYAAVYEKPGGLVEGWADPAQMQVNLSMLKNVVEPLENAGGALQHILALQGGKAYGIHLDPCIPVPAKERWPRHPHANFYWLQEDFLRERQPRKGWHFTLLRPRVVLGDALGSHMNPIPAIGVYAALRKEAGLPLAFPGGAPRLYQATDADLIASACAWAATAPTARNETFNLDNGDIFVWQNIWPAIAESLGMEVGAPEPLCLAEALPGRQAEWSALVRKYQLQCPERLQDFVGQGFAYTDFQFGYGKNTPQAPVLVSSIKIRQAGFAGCIDTEDMFRKWFQRYQDLRWLPPPDGRPGRPPAAPAPRPPGSGPALAL
ncbi:MAG: SDR family oxidoreductase [Burkholderiaceae bacterium]|nr:SDR family oxidoreductase [Burkholderiaceae bacterium]